jgi:hypothetical protein
MPTITINLPDNLNVPSNWDARMFVAAKMYEAGILSSDQAAQSVGVPLPEFAESARDYVPENAESESWFTLEQIAQFKENRRRLDEKLAKNPPPMSNEEFLQFLLHFPVADDETIQRQDEVREDMKRWKLPW